MYGGERAREKSERLSRRNGSAEVKVWPRKLRETEVSTREKRLCEKELWEMKVPERLQCLHSAEKSSVLEGTVNPANEEMRQKPKCVRMC